MRGLARCEDTKLQEFARVIFVDDLKTHVRKYEDHEPLAIRPDYYAFNDSLKSVSLIYFTE